MSARVVLFDFDGVISDTENIHIAAWELTFGEMGWVVSPEDCVRAAEIDDRVFLGELFEQRGIEGGDVAGWVARKQRRTVVMLQDSPRVYPGVAALVGALAGRARLGIVTTTWRENVAVVLRAAGLDRAFEIIVAKEDVERTKPDPEAYLLALERLGVAARDAVALEDSETGLAAARAAGLRGIAVGHRRPPGEWTGGAPYLADLTDLRRVLETLG